MSTWTHRWALPLALIASGCDTTTPERWTLSDGTAIELEIAATSARTEGDDRIAFRSEGLVVTMQRVDLVGDRARGDRTPHSVAGALVQRVELGEERGTLTQTECTQGELRGECLSGALTVGDTTFNRVGIIFSAGDSIVWLDVASSTQDPAELEDRAHRVLRSVSVRPSRAPRRPDHGGGRA
jgi:hypothetical protein